MVKLKIKYKIYLKWGTFRRLHLPFLSCFTIVTYIGKTVGARQCNFVKVPNNNLNGAYKSTAKYPISSRNVFDSYYPNIRYVYIRNIFFKSKRKEKSSL